MTKSTQTGEKLIRPEFTHVIMTIAESEDPEFVAKVMKILSPPKP